MEQTLVSLSGDPIWRNYTQEEEKFAKHMKKRQEQNLIDSIEKHPISPQTFSEAILSEMKDPDKWTAFTGVYGKVIQKNYLYNLKLRKISPFDYLKQCQPFLEIDIREGHPWIKMRRA
ncbi:hypothetical protein ACFL0D_05445 [Thermoproteota archaeon]